MPAEQGRHVVNPKTAHAKVKLHFFLEVPVPFLSKSACLRHAPRD